MAGNNSTQAADHATTERPLDRARMIADAAYFRAERRGFQGGDPLADWLEAEAQICRMLEDSPSQALASDDRAAVEERLQTQLTGAATARRRSKRPKRDSNDRADLSGAIN
jgi:Protein of unknown function (DUF2934)